MAAANSIHHHLTWLSKVDYAYRGNNLKYMRRACYLLGGAETQVPLPNLPLCILIYTSCEPSIIDTLTLYVGRITTIA